MSKLTINKILFVLIGIGIINFSAKSYGDEFAFDPPKNFSLSPEYIGLHHPVNTKQPTAQLYFDQGLTYVYAFNHEAAYWSFLKASQIDPNMAMAYWGQALALGSNINMQITPHREKIAFDLVQKASRLAENGPNNEKAYVAALRERYSNNPQANKQELAVHYSEAMRNLTDQFPDDPDAAVLYAESLLDVRPWQQWTLDGRPEKGTDEAIKALEYVLQNHPMHLGANHYYIHVLEASPYPERALMSAERLKKLLPSSGHILHMPSHIFVLVGDYEQAVLSNEQAVAVDREYIRQYGIRGIYPVHYLSHNYQFLSYAYSMQGNYYGARTAALDLVNFYNPHFTRMPELEEYANLLLFVYLGFHQWNELLNMPKPPENMHITTALWHFGRAAAFASLGNTQKAIEERKLFLAATQIPASAKYGYNYASKVFKLSQYYLDSLIAAAENRSESEIDNLQKAVVEEDHLDYDEPPNWLFSARVSLGAALIRQGRFAEAEKVFRADLKRHPRSGRSLFGLKESLAAQSKWADYYWVNEAYQRAWRFSDIDLTVDNL